ncbi:unnamed protein product [Gongylonema pulchrum]|uniref:Kelch domain-containing protein 10 n=1 Tax=Gongylonema pulchrum TaxID=637853 RepID=A0A183EDC1_9BILA|nr:unnamed protein product [Gongylonema pulchrum]
MFGGPPEDADKAWEPVRQPYRILVDEHESAIPTVGHAMFRYRNALVLWGGNFFIAGSIRHSPTKYLYILPAGLLAGCRTLKWILYHVPNGDVPPSTSNACALLCDSYVYFFGGYIRRSRENQVLEGHSSAIYVLDLEQEQWSLTVSDNVLIPTPRDKMTGWTHKNRFAQHNIFLKSNLF